MIILNSISIHAALPSGAHLESTVTLTTDTAPSSELTTIIIFGYLEQLKIEGPHGLTPVSQCLEAPGSLSEILACMSLVFCTITFSRGSCWPNQSRTRA